MTDNEIIEALKRCPQHTECCYCNSLEECGNKRILTTSVLDLINRQKAEIERLKRGVTFTITIEDFESIKETIISNIDNKIKSEAIKEFAERLKEKSWIGMWETVAHVDVDEIDNLVKEMTGGK